MGAERFSEGFHFGGGLPLELREQMSRIALDTPAPDFELSDFHGNPFRLSDLRDRNRVLLVFNRGFT